MSAARRRGLALAAAFACHGLFLAAIGWMVPALYTGLGTGLGTLRGPLAWLANGLLLAQFPLLHSFLLTDRGRRALVRLVPGGAGRTLAPTTFATVAAAQLLATFALWSPSGVVWYRPHGVWAALSIAPFAASWLLLGMALRDGGLGLQTGSIGWTALWFGRAPSYPAMPTTGTFARCRQPIYLGFAATLWTGPVWTPDHLALALVLTGYCLLGPLHKEHRFARLHGAAFAVYRARVPYIVPSLRSRNPA